MGAVSTSLLEEARSIFVELGYDVTSIGNELRAERKWRVVHVTTLAPDQAPDVGRLRCFVTRENRADAVREELLELAPDYDWAIISVGDAGYEVLHPTPEAFPAP